ncbi:ABC1-domain-containing protein [Multifurca ochricompacta]|uniref:ABC1-domain-containing protein n=1 Tax=Multifurca ochricompacta TaxID=376703 RepID=A0AAD4MGN4_9AGAM|nr:ABC1-domain-containing protein [Multifurca ochricompacta]
MAQQRLSLSLLTPTRFSRIRHLSHSTNTLFPRSPLSSRFFLRKPAIWIFPLVGGISIYLYPRPQPILSEVFASPILIPCPSDEPPTSQKSLILSPSEHDLSLYERIHSLFIDHVWEPILTARRFIHLFFLFVPIILSSPMLLVGSPEESLQGDRWGAVWWYDHLVAQMDRAGPTFIKLAQWAASRADLFPALLCERMGKMHSQGRPHSLAHTKRVVERVFQRPFDEVFEDFDETPIGSGAIAQSYTKQDLLPPSYFDPKRARKKGPGALSPTILPESKPSVPTAVVAIKVLHPRVFKLIERDLTIMSFFAHLVTLFPGMQWVSLPEEVEVFGRMMYEQLDLRKEADNLVTFEQNFMTRKAPVSFPRPLKIWSTGDLLIEEYQTALPLELFLKNGGGPYDDQLAEIGLDAFLKMLLLDNFVHSDLHPGNIMIKFSRSTTSLVLRTLWTSLFLNDTGSSVNNPTSLDSNAVVSDLALLSSSPIAWRDKLQSLHSDGYLPELVFIDAGLVTTLNAKNRQNFLELFRAIAEFDGYRAGQLMVERCRTPHLAINTETFALKMQHIVLNIKRKTFSLGQIKISDILKDVLKAVRQHHVKMEGDFINTVISILLLEGIGRQLDPKLDLFKSALPILRQLGREMTTQENMSSLPSGHLTSLLKVRVLNSIHHLHADHRTHAVMGSIRSS